MNRGVILIAGIYIGTIMMCTVCLFALSLIFLYYSMILLKRAREYKKKQEELTKMVEKRTREKYNKIALLEPPQLITYLTSIFSKMLELSAVTHISDKDHGAAEKLYGYALAETIAYLGKDTLDAIDYYYGKDFIYRWSYSSYRLAETRGYISRIITKEATHENLLSNMM